MTRQEGTNAPGAADTLRAYFREYWALGDQAAFERLVHPEVDVTARFAGEPISRADLYEIGESFRAMFDGGSIRVEDVIEQGDKAAGVVVIEARLPNTGKTAVFYGTTHLTVRDGRIVRDVTRLDTQEIFIALGRVDPEMRIASISVVA